MSHGATGEGGTVEPNLTPLLDVVLQLLMFFIMTVNFVNEQVTGEVKLPTSQSAVPLSKAETEVLFVNIKIFNLKKQYLEEPNGEPRQVDPDFLAALKKKFKDDDPCALVITEKLPQTLPELKQWLKIRYEDLDRLHPGKVDTTIVIRADENLDYKFFYQVLTYCKEAGFKNLKVRAKVGARSE